MNVAEILSVAAKSVRLALRNPGSAVVGLLVGITQQLDIRVVAEGIETQHQAKRKRSSPWLVDRQQPRRAMSTRPATARSGSFLRAS